MLTVELVFQTTSIRERRALHDGAGQNTVEDGAEQVVGYRPPGDAPAGESPDAILGPPDFPLQGIERQCLGRQQRWSRAARYVVASEGESVEEDGEAEGDDKRAWPIICQSCLALAATASIEQLTVRKTHSHVHSAPAPSLT